MSVGAKIGLSLLLFVVGALGDGLIKDLYGYRQHHSLTTAAGVAIVCLWLLPGYFAKQKHPIPEKWGVGVIAVLIFCVSGLIFSVSGRVMVWLLTEPKQTLLCRRGSGPLVPLSIDTAPLGSQTRITLTGSGGNVWVFDDVEVHSARYRAWKDWPEKGKYSRTILELDRVTGILEMWNTKAGCENAQYASSCDTGTGYDYATLTCQVAAPKF